MPANLSQPYLEAEQRYRHATSPEEKAAALEQMIALLPKHKGTEKIFADLKTKLAKLRKAGEKKGGGPARRVSEYVIEREGAGQLMLLGPPNAGKSALMAALTHAPAQVTDYPFCTRKPIPGTMRYEDVRIQLVDTPSISPEFLDPFLLPLVRGSDAAVVCIDLSSPECLDQPEWVFHALREARIVPAKATVSTTPKNLSQRELPAFVAATKLDAPDASDALELLREAMAEALPIIAVSVHRPESLQRFARACFDLFGIVRAYSKTPGKDPDRSAPFLLPIGATVLDFAQKVHKDFTSRFGFARVWGAGRYDGQRAGREDRIEDGDVIELHMS
jgi:uncharacterized protein